MEQKIVFYKVSEMSLSFHNSRRLIELTRCVVNKIYQKDYKKLMDGKQYIMSFFMGFIFVL